MSVGRFFILQAVRTEGAEMYKDNFNEKMARSIETIGNAIVGAIKIAIIVFVGALVLKHLLEVF